MSFSAPINTWAEAERASAQRKRDAELIQDWLARNTPRRFSGGTSGSIQAQIDWLNSIGFEAKWYRATLAVKGPGFRLKRFSGREIWRFVDEQRAARGMEPLSPQQRGAVKP